MSELEAEPSLRHMSGMQVSAYTFKAASFSMTAARIRPETERSVQYQEQPQEMKLKNMLVYQQQIT
jgi:hypothetical protein